MIEQILNRAIAIPHYANLPFQAQNVIDEI